MNQFLRDMREIKEMTPDLIKLSFVLWCVFCCVFLLFGTAVGVMRVSAILSGFVVSTILGVILLIAVTLSVFHNFVVVPVHKFLVYKCQSGYQMVSRTGTRLWIMLTRHDRPGIFTLHLMSPFFEGALLQLTLVLLVVEQWSTGS